MTAFTGQKGSGRIIKPDARVGNTADQNNPASIADRARINAAAGNVAASQEIKVERTILPIKFRREKL